MGYTYVLHTEAKIDGEWRCIDGYYWLRSHMDDDKEKLKLAVLYENGSRSYFGSTYDKLLDLSESVLFSDLSKEIQAEYEDLKYTYDLFGEKSQVEAKYEVIPINKFYSKVPTGFSRHGIVHKDRIKDFENGDIDELWDESPEMKKLPEISKELYQYYEWDDYDDWPIHFKEINNRVREAVDKYLDNAWYLFDEVEIRLVVFVF